MRSSIASSTNVLIVSATCLGVVAILMHGTASQDRADVFSAFAKCLPWSQ